METSMTTHTWKSNATGGLYDPTNYVDGLPFVVGDTLVFDGGTGQWTGALNTGTYMFNGSDGTNSLSLTDGTLDGSSTISENGTGQLTINSSGQFINDGTLDAGVTSATGTVELIANSNGGEAAGVTNNGQITLQSGGLRITPTTPTSFVNSATGTIMVTDGGALEFKNAAGYVQGDGNSFVNNGLIIVSDLNGGYSAMEVDASYSGSGTLFVKGTAGASTPSFVNFVGPASGNFDVASGDLAFEGNGPVQGTINFLDADGMLSLFASGANSSPAYYLPLQATVNHFAAGDQITLDTDQPYGGGFSYDQTTHVLDIYSGTIADRDTGLAAQITFAGNYTTSDFHVTEPILALKITTTNSLNGTQTVAPGGSFSGDNGNPIIDTQGNATVTTGTGASTVYLAGGSNLVRAQGNDTIVSSTGNDTVYASTPVQELAGSTGTLTFVSAGYSTVTGGAEAMTVFGGSGGGNVVRGGAGLTEFIGGGGAGSDFIGGQGAEIVFGGTGGDTISGGAAGGFIYGADAATTIYGGAGNSTITAGNANTVLLNGAASNLVAAGAGNMTLVGGGSTGNNSVFGGSGVDQLAGGAGADFFRAGTGTATMTGGGGTNLFAFDHGSAGGSTVITDFHNAIDHLTLQGYGSNAVAAALGSATISGGSTFLALQDGTHITLAGVTNLTAASFV